MDKDKPTTATPLNLSTPYLCGLDYAKNGICNANKKSRFTEPADLAEWDRGCAEGMAGRD